MSRVASLRRMAVLACAAVTMAGLAPQATATPRPSGSHQLPHDTRFYVDPAGKAAKQAVADLRAGRLADALNMAKLASWPESFWLTEGTPDQVRTKVEGIMRAAKATRTVPVLVLYNVPGRDCSNYSSGGAADAAAYDAWVKAVARGIGSGKALTVVEPDGLALLPQDCGADVDPDGTRTAERFASVKSAIETLEQQPSTSVYVDGGTSNWQPPGVITQRLLAAGVQKAQGIALNVSNYQPTDQLNRYATWVSQCIHYATHGSGPVESRASECASQYYSASAPNDGAPGNSVTFEDPATWHWTDAWYDKNVGTVPADRLTHYVLDTSRNGLGAWTAPDKYTDDEHWCNAPGRGVGVHPTADTGLPLADAYLYVKIIGESDGTCHRGTPGPGDPEYGGGEDPPAGAWWPDFAHTLARNARPGLTWNLPH
ncbi:glycoside hydrolase family 6 protein [Streptomyces sp. ITFR-16]|uniref:glycoside hydrolase family 6 protein n=1 Tax=Streptomyces sp. ITFR-16 TaxID=3075198 RepID=UPI00288BCAEA|nr:glycoside hydrolase family 6 protein [Streptomyces sp. ITFR-16]WNI21485.1 glycoside hydrolase family 6 protein [Streptomyces sp. ITFR-16]